MKQHKPAPNARAKTQGAAAKRDSGRSFASKAPQKAPKKDQYQAPKKGGWSPMTEADIEMEETATWRDERRPERGDQRPGRPQRAESKGKTYTDRRAPEGRRDERPDSRKETRQDPRKDTRRPERSPDRRDDRDQPRLKGGEVIYGRHAVTAALQNKDRQLSQLWLTDADMAATLPIPRGLKPQIADRRTLDRMIGDRLRSESDTAVHQGIVLVAEPLPELHLRDLLSADSHGPLVILDQVTDPHNLGAILRSAAVFGAAALITTERHAPAASGVMAKAASGAMEIVPVVRVVNLARALREIGDAGYHRLGLAEGGTQTIAEAASGQEKVALVLGAEGDGLRRLTKENCDALVSLTSEAPVDSFTTLNVSNAAAVALFAITQSLNN